jgi:hypothetical protein
MTGTSLERQDDIVWSNSGLVLASNGAEVTLCDFRTPNEGVTHMTFSPLLHDTTGSGDDLTLYFYIQGSLSSKILFVSAGPTRIAPDNFQIMRYPFTIKPNMKCKITYQWNDNGSGSAPSLSLQGFGRVFPSAQYRKRA